MSKSPIARLADHVEDRAEAAAADLNEDVQAFAADTQKSLTKAARALASASRSLSKQAKKQGRNAARFTDREIHQRPIATVAVVLSAVAALAGVALARRA